MSATVLRALTIFSILGCGLVAGVFFAFSSFVMRALDRLPPAQAIAAMQAINTAAPTAWFMSALFGTALGCVVLGISALGRLSEPGAVLSVVGCTLYLVTIAATVVYHVPRNDALATADPGAGGAGDLWNHYFAGWTLWNHVRTLSALGAAAAFTLALRAPIP